MLNLKQPNKAEEQFVLTHEAIGHYWDYPVDFINDNIIGPARSVMPELEMSWQQRDALNAIAKYPRVSIESGHGTGKSTTFAWAALWFTATRYNNSGNLVKVPVIAPTFHQLYDIIWPEFKRWIPLSRLRNLYEMNSEAVYIKGAKDNCFIRARSPKDSDSVQGFHAAHLLWCADEAFGIKAKDIWVTVEGSCTDDLGIQENKMLIGGQHTTIIGYAHNTFHKNKDFWVNLRFNSEKSPLADKAFAQRIARQFGRDSDIYRIRVLGTEPKGNPTALMQVTDVEEARLRTVEPVGRLSLGIDPSRFGNDMTVVTLAHGKKVFPQKSLSKSDTDDIVNLALNTLREYRDTSGCQQTCFIFVDDGGGYGGGTIDTLRKNREDNIDVIPVKNEFDNNHPKYADNASVMWGEVAEMLDELDLPNDEDSDFLLEELTGRNYSHDKQGRIKLEPKAIYKKNHEENSPDRADSLVLALTQGARPKRIFANYVSTNANYNRKYKIDWDKADPIKAQVAVVLVGEKDFGISGSNYFWGRESKILRMYDEFFCVNPTAPEIAVKIKETLQIPLATNNSTEICCSGVYANAELFRGGADTIEQLKKYGIKVREFKNYDQSGSIMLVNALLRTQQICVHTRAKESSRQIETWANKRGQPEKGFPQCTALCMMASILRMDGELSGTSKYQKYSQSKMALREKLYKANQVGGRLAPKTNKKSEYEYLM